MSEGMWQILPFWVAFTIGFRWVWVYVATNIWCLKCPMSKKSPKDLLCFANIIAFYSFLSDNVSVDCSLSAQSRSINVIELEKTRWWKERFTVCFWLVGPTFPLLNYQNDTVCMQKSSQKSLTQKLKTLSFQKKLKTLYSKKAAVLNADFLDLLSKSIKNWHMKDNSDAKKSLWFWNAHSSRFILIYASNLSKAAPKLCQLNISYQNHSHLAYWAGLTKPQSPRLLGGPHSKETQPTINATQMSAEQIFCLDFLIARTFCRTRTFMGCLHWIGLRSDWANIYIIFLLFCQ